MTFLVPYDIPTVPSAPASTLPPYNTLDKSLQETITTVESLFTDRPAWTRRGLRNSIPSPDQRYLLRHAIPYVGYIFRSGPWRDAILKFGHDPRTSPSYRLYQTVMFRLIPREPELARDGGHGRRHTFSRPNDSFASGSALDPVTPDSHIFTGSLPLHVDGRIWMACDIVDPLVHAVLFPAAPPPNFLRTTCDPVTDGWFGNGTLAKAKTIMRNKVLALMNGVELGDGEFEKILDFPDHGDAEDLVGRFMLNPKEARARDLALATEVRAMMKGSASWKEKTREAEEVGRNWGVGGGEGVRDGEGKGAGGGKRVQFQDEGVGPGEEDESQGEEEAIEREEILEAQAAAAAESVNAALERAGEEQQESSEGEDHDEQMDEVPNGESEGKGKGKAR